MPESFSRPSLNINMADLASSDDDSVLDILRDILSTERSFHGITRFLEGHTRNHIVAAHMRNQSAALHILRTFMDRPPVPHTTTMVLNMDLSGNILRNFMDPVPVVPTAEQLRAGTETNVRPTNETCPICRDPVLVGTRLRACDHVFHASCIDEWFTLNPRCPVCRHDVREPVARAGLRTPSPPARGRRTYSEHPDQA